MRAVRFRAVAPVAVNQSRSTHENIDVTRLNFPAVCSLPLEIVEREGIGHPDTICDALVETISGELSRYYVAASGFADTSRIWMSSAMSVCSRTFVPRRPISTRCFFAAMTLANDTSFGVGFAPLDDVERVVLKAAQDERAVLIGQPEQSGCARSPAWTFSKMTSYCPSPFAAG